MVDYYRITKRSLQKPIKIISTCPKCHNIQIYGVCNACGWASICARCKSVKQPNNTWLKIHYDTSADVTHGMCHDCLIIMYPEFYPKKVVAV